MRHYQYCWEHLHVSSVMCHETRAMSQVTHNCLLLLVMEVFPQELHVPQTVRKHLTHIWLYSPITQQGIKYSLTEC